MTKITKGWPPERRRQQAERAKKNKPWENSTGPKTVSGKQTSSQNAYQHGRRSLRYIIAYRRLSQLLKLQKLSLKLLTRPDYREESK